MLFGGMKNKVAGNGNKKEGRVKIKGNLKLKRHK
jgi:hypothetical protein